MYAERERLETARRMTARVSSTRTGLEGEIAEGMAGFMSVEEGFLGGFTGGGFV